MGLALLGSACASEIVMAPGTHRLTEPPSFETPPAAEGAGASPLRERQVVEVPPPPAAKDEPKGYRLGPLDVVSIRVRGQPELSSADKGSRIGEDGMVQLPMAGSVAMGGLTLSEAQARLTEAYKKFLKEPCVVVEILDYKSQPLYLLGGFGSPGAYYLDRPLRLVQGLSLGGGVRPDADLKRARLVREGEILPVDIRGLLLEGDLRQNIWLKPNDTIYVPPKEDEIVYVFGAVKKPGPVPMLSGRLTLAQAVASADLADIDYNANDVRIIRSLSATKGELLVLDLRSVIDGRSAPYPLVAGDIVYVTKGRIGAWNELMKEAMPTANLLNTMLMPWAVRALIQ